MMYVVYKNDNGNTHWHFFCFKGEVLSLPPKNERFHYDIRAFSSNEVAHREAWSFYNIFKKLYEHPQMVPLKYIKIRYWRKDGSV